MLLITHWPLASPSLTSPSLKMFSIFRRVHVFLPFPRILLVCFQNLNLLLCVGKLPSIWHCCIVTFLSHPPSPPPICLTHQRGRNTASCFWKSFPAYLSKKVVLLPLDFFEKINLPTGGQVDSWQEGGTKLLLEKSGYLQFFNLQGGPTTG